jgi:GYF domain 2
MNWFYATKDKTQAGPVDETALADLLQTGTITPNTLVWKQGMDSWRPYSTVFGMTASPGTVPHCAECGKEFPPDQLVPIGGRSICALCKPIAVQKLQEGVVSFETLVSAAELWARVEKRGFDFQIMGIVSETWEMVKKNLWPCIGVTLLCYLIMMGAGQIPLLGILATFFVQTQIMSGLNIFFLKQIRGESATLNDAFTGFRRGYLQQALYMLLITLAIFVPIIAVMIPAFAMGSALNSKGSGVTLVLVLMAFMIPAMLVIWYLMLSWIFTPLLIVDKGLKAIEAMKLSWRVVRLRFWKLLGLFFVVGLLCLAGLLALIVGVIFVLPIAFGVISKAYEEAFGD